MRPVELDWGEFQFNMISIYFLKGKISIRQTLGIEFVQIEGQTMPLFPLDASSRRIGKSFGLNRYGDMEAARFVLVAGQIRASEGGIGSPWPLAED
jgi:hypothetical protein